MAKRTKKLTGCALRADCEKCNRKGFVYRNDTNYIEPKQCKCLEECELCGGYGFWPDRKTNSVINCKPNEYQSAMSKVSIIKMPARILRSKLDPNLVLELKDSLKMTRNVFVLSNFEKYLRASVELASYNYQLIYLELGQLSLLFDGNWNKLLEFIRPWETCQYLILDGFLDRTLNKFTSQAFDLIISKRYNMNLTNIYIVRDDKPWDERVIHPSPEFDVKIKSRIGEASVYIG